ncbi:MAG: flagellar basal-body rod protein FlgF [Thermoleophilaceae bacterium]|jgi:flagellar basal-body rod protein FlgG|nr:flagellar basal-body rod protein FlgF [Thermoleophilaceae bacterium]
MERGLYIAASGMLSEMVRQDQIANDLSNASTPGYKSDRATQKSFGDILLANSITGQTVGPLGLGSQIDSIVTDTTAAPVRDTGEPLDFAVTGDGWFGIQTPQGVRYTRNGQFGVSPQGTLIDSMGNQVIGKNGGPVPVGADGHANASQLGVFNVTNPRKIGNSYVTGAAAGQATGLVRQGALEGSNADPSRSMVDMIASFRAFESGQRVIRTIDETLSKASNVVGGMP